MKKKNIANYLKNSNVKLEYNKIKMKEKFKKFFDLKTQIDKICVGEVSTWKDRILLESIQDIDFYNTAKEIFFNIEKMNSNELDNCFQNTIQKANLFKKDYEETTDFGKNTNCILKWKDIMELLNNWTNYQQLVKIPIKH